MSPTYREDALSTHAAALDAPDAPALIELRDGALTTTTYAALDALVTARIAALDLAHVRRAALVGAPTTTTLVDLLALVTARVPFVGLHPRWTPAERARALDEFAPELVLEHGQSTRRDAPHGPVSRATLAVLYTSGTTGRAKGAVLSRRAFVAGASMSAARLGWEPNDRWLLAMPLAHVGGLSLVLRALLARATLVLDDAPSFDPARLVHALERTETTLLSLVPTQLARLVESGLRAPRSLRLVLLGGAGCPATTLLAARALGWPLRTTYGLTEMGSQVATSRGVVEGPDEGSGVPLEGVDVVVREGRLHVRSPAQMDGWLAPDLPHPFDADGFYDTGDLGELDAEGRVHVRSRRTDLVVSGGENVYPAEVEDALLALDGSLAGVVAACVVGLPDPTWGERVAAALVVRPDDAPRFTLSAVQDALATKLARFKLPRALVLLDALPTNAVGKVDREAVRRALRAASRSPA